MFWLAEDMLFPDDLERSFHNGWLTNAPVSCRVPSEPNKPAVTPSNRHEVSREGEGSCDNLVLVPDEDDGLFRLSQSMEHLSGVTEELEFYCLKDPEKCSIPGGITKNVNETGANPSTGTTGHVENQCVIFLPRTKSHPNKLSRRRKRSVK